ncbi:MAG TPA: alpha/beta fold hydrolase [Polyangiaceae bacterium]|nr:alpha/beta fold hydrolase [Polyangiaceae bacterium]
MGVVVGLLGAYVALATLAFVGQRALMYPRPSGQIEPNASGARMERISAAGGTRACALYVPAPQGRPTVVHFHGNGEDLSDQTTLVEELAERGLGVYAVEYPGYGLLRDEALSEHAVYTSAEAALRHLHDRLGVAPRDVVLQGQSLGTGVAVEMARRGHAARLILISPFTSMTDMARKLLPWLPVSLLVRDRYETKQKVSALSLPVLILHGTADEVIPVSMGRRVADLLPNAKLVLIEGGGHNDLFTLHGQRVLSEIVAFAGAAD